MTDLCNEIMVSASDDRHGETYEKCWGMLGKPLSRREAGGKRRGLAASSLAGVLKVAAPCCCSTEVAVLARLSALAW